MKDHVNNDHLNLARLLAGILVATAALGQSGSQSSSADPLAPLQQAAEKRAVEWEALAKSLEVKLARMLPCDARVRTSIEEVSRASDARLAAFSQYLKAVAEQAKTDVDRVQRQLSERAGSAQEAETEKAEAEQERTAIGGRAADLSESAKTRESLSEAQKKLAEIAAMTRERSTRAQEQVGRREALAASLRELGSTYEARQRALETEFSALLIETSRWSEYYAARLARAQTECAVTNSSAPQPGQAPQRKKK